MFINATSYSSLQYIESYGAMGEAEVKQHSLWVLNFLYFLPAMVQKYAWDFESLTTPKISLDYTGVWPNSSLDYILGIGEKNPGQKWHHWLQLSHGISRHGAYRWIQDVGFAVGWLPISSKDVAAYSATGFRIDVLNQSGGSTSIGRRNATQLINT